MKVNYYECDSCGARVENYRQYKLTVKYPVPESIKTITRVNRDSREQKTLDLCDGCYQKVAKVLHMV